MKLNFTDASLIVFCSIAIACILYLLFSAVMFVYETQLMWF